MAAKINLSVQIKMACVSTAADITLRNTKFPIGLAKDEIIWIHASKFMLNRASALSGYTFKSILYRKTENIPTNHLYLSPSGGWRTDKNVIDVWFALGHNQRTAENIAPVPPLYQVYAKPIPLIRTPTFIYHSTGDLEATLLLWYHTEKISDKDLLELMVKDHA